MKGTRHNAEKEELSSDWKFDVALLPARKRKEPEERFFAKNLNTH